MLNSPYAQKICKPSARSLSGRIRAQLVLQPDSAYDIAWRMGETEKTIKGLLSSMQSTGFVRADRANRPIIWSLTEKGRRAVEGK